MTTINPSHSSASYDSTKLAVSRNRDATKAVFEIIENKPGYR